MTIQNSYILIFRYILVNSSPGYKAPMPIVRVMTDDILLQKVSNLLLKMNV